MPDAPCQIVYEHDPGSKTTKLSCKGTCKTRYKRVIQAGHPKYVPVIPTCVLLTPVEFKDGGFQPKGKGLPDVRDVTQTGCYCTLEPIGDPPCKYEPEVDPHDAKKLTGASCKGHCGDYYDDDAGKKHTPLTCLLAINAAGAVACYCVITE
jgi:hypothetical protein